MCISPECEFKDGKGKKIMEKDKFLKHNVWNDFMTKTS